MKNEKPRVQISFTFLGKNFFYSISCIYIAFLRLIALNYIEKKRIIPTLMWKIQVDERNFVVQYINFQFT